jgi:epoxide hydrolase-like predicted phosphatase
MNVVFDLGGVVFTWNPDWIIDGVFGDEQSRQIVREKIFHHSDWAALDRGTLARKEAIERAVSRTGLSKPEISALMQRIPQALVPIPETLDIIRRLKQNPAHKLFVLSNMHVASIDHIDQTYPIWDDLFDGMVISCRIHMAKPELRIYQYLLETLGLNAADTIFIDDTQKNLEPASQLGMHTILFETSQQCERELIRRGYLIGSLAISS